MGARPTKNEDLLRVGRAPSPAKRIFQRSHDNFMQAHEEDFKRESV
jgi:hypothetical protein